MALPLTYNDPEIYFRSCIDFLKEYSWIYQISNIRFIKEGILEKITEEEMNYFSNVKTEELNLFPLVGDEHLKDAPKSLMKFRADLKELIPREVFQEDWLFPSYNSRDFKKISLKKQHEINRLSHIINEQCKSSELLIDLGSGLGYLNETLYRTNTDYKILGLEADNQRVMIASRRKLEYIPKASYNTVIYKQHFVTENSVDFIMECAREMLHKHKIEHPQLVINWSLIGLHACADLSVTSIRLFFSMNRVKWLIIMPCCYHKLEMLNERTFRNFPLSQSLQKAITATDTTDARSMYYYFNRPFLRLACQQSLKRWQNSTAEEHRRHGSLMWQRAVAEAILNEAEKVVKCKSRPGGDPMQTRKSLTFEMLQACYSLRSSADNRSLSWQKSHELRFDEIQRLYPEGSKLAEGLTCLQTSMQKLCENIVLYDRLCFMQEYAASKNLKITARYIKPIDEDISPRCYALVAEKIVN